MMLKVPSLPRQQKVDPVDAAVAWALARSPKIELVDPTEEPDEPPSEELPPDEEDDL